jgi:V-type H+-transporting ATPase subunit E
LLPSNPPPPKPLQHTISSHPLQGLLLILSPSCTLTVRKADRTLATSAAEAASKAYTDISGRKCTVAVEENEELPADGAGGVKLAGAGGRIKVDNSLDERLGLLEDKVSFLP